ncbi:MAG: prepilin-type N-terminal cleavage/methylation domain-containing protein [Lysobacterales bacterium]|nr:MAG: prepilin-type N-terminal cleavage/methylation domain-containing protein [Xanthomonadales bacterium]
MDGAEPPEFGAGSNSVFTLPAATLVVNSAHKHTRAHSTGFTLIEVALALVVIALLTGGILKGLQILQSARVRTLAATTTSVQSVYFAFYDRYGHVAGDWNAVDAGNAIGRVVTGGGDDSGYLETPPADPWTESNAFWEQLAKAGFIRGEYQGTAATEPTVNNDLTPLNVFHRPIIIGRTMDYEGAIAPRRHIIVGRGVPAGMLLELDTKLDDGDPGAGKVRATVDDAAVSVFGGASSWGGRESGCVNGSTGWDVNADAQDCNALLIF